MSKLALEKLERMRALAQMIRGGSIDGQSFHIEQPMQVHFHELKRVIVESTLLQMEMLAAIELGEAVRQDDAAPDDNPGRAWELKELPKDVKPVGDGWEILFVRDAYSVVWKRLQQ